MNILAMLAATDVLIASAWVAGVLESGALFTIVHTSLTIGATVASVSATVRSAAAAPSNPDLVAWTPWRWSGLALPLGMLLGAPGILISSAFARMLRGRGPHVVAPPDPVGQRRTPGRHQAEEVMLARLLDERISIPPAEHVEALSRILRDGPLNRRCAALQAVVRSFEPRLTPLVATALADPDQTVRALAAATAAQAAAKLTEMTARAEQATTQSLNERYEMAMALYDHGCHNVLLSRSQAAGLRSKARTCLAGVLNECALPDRARKIATQALGQLNGWSEDGSAACAIHLAPEAVA